MPKPPHTYDDQFALFAQIWFDDHTRNANREDGPAFMQPMENPMGAVYMTMNWYKSDDLMAARTVDWYANKPRVTEWNCA